MVLNPKQTNVIYGIAAFLCFMPFFSPGIALITGILFSILGIQRANTKAYTSFLLQASIVFLGFGMDLEQVIDASKAGFMWTTLSVAFVIFCGFLINKFFRVDPVTSLLISVGTAICGGSAIAAVSPIIKAKSHQVTFSLLVVFVLNAVALFVFPVVGHWFNLSQESFGYWAAIAIHDTSSVVGAGAAYGSEALEVATTVKLIRALWIIPLSLIIAFFQKGRGNEKVKLPWFIAFFAAAIFMAHLFPALETTFAHLNWLGKRGMIVALFLIGSSLSFCEMKKAGFKSFFFGILLWLLIGMISLIVLNSN